MVGMILDVFPSYKDKDMVDLLYQFERATGSSLNILVEKYLERVLYERGYLNGVVEEDNTKLSAPKPKKKGGFVKQKWEDNAQIKKGDLHFGSVKLDVADDIIAKLGNFSEEELENISKTNWGYPKKYYSQFLLAKLEDNSITPDSFMESICLIHWRERDNHGRIGTDILFNNKLVARFSHDKYSQNEIEDVISFLKGFSAEDLDWLISKRKKSKEQSGAYVLKYMNSYLNGRK